MGKLRLSAHVCPAEGDSCQPPPTFGLQAPALLAYGLQPMLKDQLGAKIDVVITWVNYADPNYCQRVYGTAPRCSGDFVELKYLLRSYEKFGFLNHIGRIHVVHSDLHEPPIYLKQDHPQLRFVRHSQLVRKPEYLPLTTQEAITSNLHHIPELSEWFVYAEDDTFAMRPWKTLADFYPQGGPTVYTSEWVPDRYYTTEESTSAGWINGIFESCKLLEARFGKRPRRINSHMPHMLHKEILFELEGLWPEHFERTWRSSRQNHICVEVLHNEYLVDTGQAIRYSVHKPQFGLLCYGKEIHTNDEKLNPPVNRSKIVRLRARLTLREHDSLFVNVQGPGISDEYEPASAYQDVISSWLEKHFPKKSEFER